MERDGGGLGKPLPHQHTGPATVRVPSSLLQAHQPHPLQLAPVHSVCLLARSPGPLASSSVGQQHGGQLTIHTGQLLCPSHTLPCGKGQGESGVSVRSSSTATGWSRSRSDKRSSLGSGPSQQPPFHSPFTPRTSDPSLWLTPVDGSLREEPDARVYTCKITASPELRPRACLPACPSGVSALAPQSCL